MIPPTLAARRHSLPWPRASGQAAPETSNAVAVSVPAARKPRRRPRRPKPSARPALAARAGDADPGDIAADRRVPVAIQSVEADGAGGLVARGSAEPNALVRLYLNGAYVADAKTKRRRPLVAHDQARHDARRLRGARRRDQSGRREGRRVRRDAVRLSGRLRRPRRARPPRCPAPRPRSGGLRRPTWSSTRSRPRQSAPATRYGRSARNIMATDALPDDLRGQQVGDPQPEPHLSRARCSSSRSGD